MTIGEVIDQHVMTMLTDEALEVRAILPDGRVVGLNVPIDQLKTSPYPLRLGLRTVATKYLDVVEGRETT